MTIKKLFDNLPSYPHYKMNVFSGTNSIEEIKSVLQMLIFGNKIVRGEDEKNYNESLKKYLNNPYIYTFASGRMGLYTILKTIGIQKDDEIIIPSFTCIVVPNAILYCDAKPVFCEIKSDDFNIDVSKIESLITSKTKVLYAQHTFGQMCEVDAIMEVAKKYNLIVIEDAALALGAKIGDRHAGTIGDFGYYSTDRSKVINTGLGGAVSINNHSYRESFEKWYENIPYLEKSLTNKIAITFVINGITLHPTIYWLGKFINALLSKLKLLTYFLDEPYTKKELITNYPYPAKLSNIFAKIGFSQLKKLEENLQTRKKTALYYNDILKIYSDEYVKNEKNIFLRYSFLVRNRERWEQKFSSRIDLSIWFKTIASGRNQNFHEINYTLGSNPISEYVCDHIFNLPTHRGINPKKLQKLLYELKNSGDIISKENIL